MDNKDKYEQKRCINCGAPLSGRTDKIFCCGRCKNEWHNHITLSEKRRKERVFGALWRNYKILEMMLDSKEKAPEILALGEMGFRDEYVTGFCKRRNGRHEYRCSTSATIKPKPACTISGGLRNSAEQWLSRSRVRRW